MPTGAEGCRTQLLAKKQGASEAHVCEIRGSNSHNYLNNCIFQFLAYLISVATCRHLENSLLYFKRALLIAKIFLEIYPKDFPDFIC